MNVMARQDSKATNGGVARSDLIIRAARGSASRSANPALAAHHDQTAIGQ